MSAQETITGLDMGSNYIRAVMLRKFDNQNFQVVGTAENTSEGINKGMVSNIEDVVTCISEVLEQLERMSSLPIRSAVVGISGTHIKTLESNGVVAVAKADREITEEDVERAIQAAQTVATPPNYDILHVIPRVFTVDNQSGIKDPVGMTGVRLEVSTKIIIGLTSQIKNLTKCIYRTGVDIGDLVFGVLACAESTLNKKQKELGVALVNLGSQTTSLIVFEEGDVLHTAILPIGSAHITSDIAIGLRTSLDVAEAVKLEVAQANSEKVSKREEIDLAKFSPTDKERTMVSLKEICEITEARCDEIFKMIDQELKKIDRSGLLPAGIVLTGGGAKLNGLVDRAKEKLKLPVFLGVPQGFEESGVDKINDPAYTTAVGLALWGEGNITKRSSIISLSPIPSVKQAVDKMKDWFKNLIP